MDRGIDWMYTGGDRTGGLAQEDAEKHAEEFLLGKEFAGEGATSGDFDNGDQDQGIHNVISQAAAAEAAVDEQQQQPQQQQGEMMHTHNEPSVKDRNESFRMRVEDPMFLVTQKQREKVSKHEKTKALYERVVGHHQETKGEDKSDNNNDKDDDRNKKRSKKERKRHKKSKKRKEEEEKDDDDRKTSIRRRRRSRSRSNERHRKRNRRSRSSSRSPSEDSRDHRREDHHRKRQDRSRRRDYEDHDDDHKRPRDGNSSRRDDRKRDARRYSSDDSEERHHRRRRDDRGGDRYHYDRRGYDEEDRKERPRPRDEQDRKRSPEIAVTMTQKKEGFGLKGAPASSRASSSTIHTTDLGPSRELLQHKRDERDDERRRIQEKASSRRRATGAERAKALHEMQANARQRDETRARHASSHRSNNDNHEEDAPSKGNASFLKDITQQTHGISGVTSLSARVAENRHTNQRLHDSFL
jgi:hypothetical protein